MIYKNWINAQILLFIYKYIYSDTKLIIRFDKFTTIYLLSVSLSSYLEILVLCRRCAFIIAGNIRSMARHLKLVARLHQHDKLV